MSAHQRHPRRREWKKAAAKRPLFLLPCRCLVECFAPSKRPNLSQSCNAPKQLATGKLGRPICETAHLPDKLGRHLKRSTDDWLFFRPPPRRHTRSHSNAYVHISERPNLYAHTNIYIYTHLAILILILIIHICMLCTSARIKHIGAHLVWANRRQRLASRVERAPFCLMNSRRTFGRKRKGKKLAPISSLFAPPLCKSLSKSVPILGTQLLSSASQPACQLAAANASPLLQMAGAPAGRIRQARLARAACHRAK